MYYAYWRDDYGVWHMAGRMRPSYRWSRYFTTLQYAFGEDNVTYRFHQTA